MPAGFRADRLGRIAEIEDSHFWFRGRRELIDRLRQKYLLRDGSRLLDLGCGTGVEVERLVTEGFPVVGVDLRPEGLFALRTFPFSGRFLQGEATRIPCRDASFGAVFLLDVLEHLDEEALLREVRRVLVPGGFAFLTVPAFPWLWSHRDDDSGHLRRYTRPSLERALSRGGLAVREVCYYQCLIFPLVVLFRLLGRRGPTARDLEDRPIPGLNRVLAWINMAEARMGKVISWPWGSSLVAVGQKG